MRFEVRWVKEAEDELARLWLDAENRHSITEAAYAVDGELREFPETAGESRRGSRRVLFAPPLLVTFDVRRDDALVLVLNVRLVRKRE